MADPPPAPTYVANADEDAIARAAAERDLAAQRLDALLTLRQRRHATTLEVLAAEHALRVAEAQLIAEQRIRAVGPADRDAELATIAGSRFAVLPAAIARETPQPSEEATQLVSTTPTPQVVRQLRTLLAREAADTSADVWWRLERTRIGRLREATLSLHADRHASDRERDAILAASAQLDAAIDADAARRQRLAELAGTDAGDLTDAGDPFAVRLDDVSPDVRDAAALSRLRLVESELALAVASSELTLARSHHRLIAEVPESARQPRELERATVRRDQAAALRDAAAADRALAGAWAGWLASLDSVPNASDLVGLPLSPLPSPARPAAEPIAAETIDATAAEDRLLSQLLMNSRRRQARAAELRRPLGEPIGSRYDLGLAGTPVSVFPYEASQPFSGLNLGSVASPGSTYLFQPGATYSSGYAFGQIRRDLPRELRYPRADGYGGPWSLPGSPTDRLRFRLRTPLRWGW